MSITVQETAKAANRALGKVIATFKNCGGSNQSIFTKLFDTAVLPVIKYSAGLWGLTEHRCLNTVLNKAGRFLLCTPPKSPNVATQGEMGWNSVLYHSRLEVIRLYCRLKHMDERRINKRIFLWSDKLNCRNWTNKAKKFMTDNNLHDIVETDIGGKLAGQLSTPILQVMESTKWNSKLWDDGQNVNGNKLRTYRTFKNTLEPESYLDLNIPRYQRSAYAKLRCGVLPLEIETGRYSNTPLENRVCKLCTMQVLEDECHFLLDCPLYADYRDTIYQKALEIDDNFLDKSKQDKMCFLLSSKYLAYSVIKVVDKMFARRKTVITH
jgi:hypothetical protein